MQNNHKGGRSRAQSADPMDAIYEDIAAIKRDVGNLISGRLGAISKRALEAKDQACDTAEELHERLAQTVNGKPVRTILIAAAAGFAGAKLLHWMSRR